MMHKNGHLTTQAVTCIKEYVKNFPAEVMDDLILVSDDDDNRIRRIAMIGVMLTVILREDIQTIMIWMLAVIFINKKKTSMLQD